MGSRVTYAVVVVGAPVYRWGMSISQPQAGVTLDAFTGRYAARTAGMTASEIRALFAVASRPEVVSLAGGMPYTSALPLDSVGKLLSDLLATRGAQALQYGSGQGDLRLRELICEIMALEGVHGSPDDVVVTVGSQQALDLVTRIFCDPGDVVLAEAPSYVGALGTFAAYEAQVRHVAMDDDGLVPEALREAIAQAGGRAKFLYTIPNFHNPAGVSLSDARRTEVLEICAEAGLLVLEDNPYGLLGFDGPPTPAIAARAGADQVVYLGSFSKTFAPGLRVGWVLAPHAVREKLVLATEAAVLCPPQLNQLAVVDYLETQDWQGQIEVFKGIYRERRDALLDALTQLMPRGTTWTKPTGGFYVWTTLPEGLDAKVMQPRAITARVAYVPGIGFYADDQGARELRLSYCFPEPDRIREGVRRLAGVVEAELDLLATFGPTARGASSGSADALPGHAVTSPEGPSGVKALVLAGGLSHERDVSLRSGRRVADALRATGLAVDVLDADGRLLEQVGAYDACLIALHGGAGEDGALREVLDLAGLPYVGSTPDACRLAWDKPTTKALLRRAGLRTPEAAVLPHDTFRELGAPAVLAALEARLGLPAHGQARPRRLGAGLHPGHRGRGPPLGDGRVLLLRRGGPGRAARDRGGGGGDRARRAGRGARLPAVEVRPLSGVYDYAARYTAGATEFFAPARLDADTAAAVGEAAVAAHVALGLRDLSRVDAIVAPDGNVWVLEVNVSPGMTETSLLPMAVEAGGLRLGEVLADLLVRAASRQAPRSSVADRVSVRQ